MTTSVVTDLVRILTEGEREDVDNQVLGAHLRHPAGEALSALAVVVRDGDDADRGPAYEAVHALRTSLAHERSHGTGDDYLAAGAMVLDIERALEANRSTREPADDESEG
ncbi:hypothetical protein [Cellulosimicrobium sp. CUA-896]|uniref:hypothetical protein n=1 Tax=Cellulosimicrobium sp. CUA-896 TaxID=1517881 RepID=UPI0009632960|nr:hypothetical protein [Cellulosimicrobium sp. CUA-896]OLT49534.1 hypothetical protein BJF88_15930 [Cellulosimicrobium sp. CUA-896]